MTLPALASTDELSARVPGGIATADLTRAQAALDDASSKIRAETSRSWCDDDDNLALPDEAWKADTLVRICLASALRAFSNPEGVIEEHLGPFGQQFGGASPDVYLTSAERRDLRKVVGAPALGAIPLTRGRPLDADRLSPYGQDTQYLDTSDGGVMPWLAGDVGY
jgi:hypothetical protein